MKRKLIALVLASATTIGALGINTGITAKAESFNKIYESAYNCVSKLQELGKKHHITPRLKDNGSKMEDNNLKDVVDASEEMQKTIDELRVYQYQFPNAYWKAKNTFSEIGDGYQQPIYEWIVDIAIRLEKEGHQIEESKTISKKEVSNFIKKAETELGYANQLNKGVDEAYQEAYKVALINVDAVLRVLKENLETGNRWVNNNNKWYYLNKDNQPLTGWQWITGSNYFFNQDGSMKTGWYSIESQGKSYWSYLKPTGQSSEGWEKINNKWYYFDTEVGEMKTGWVGLRYNRNGRISDFTYNRPNGQAGFKFYYMNESGEMVTDNKIINGISYNFDNSGALIK